MCTLSPGPAGLPGLTAHDPLRPWPPALSHPAASSGLSPPTSGLPSLVCITSWDIRPCPSTPCPSLAEGLPACSLGGLKVCGDFEAHCALPGGQIPSLSVCLPLAGVALIFPASSGCCPVPWAGWYPCAPPSGFPLPLLPAPSLAAPCCSLCWSLVPLHRPHLTLPPSLCLLLFPLYLVPGLLPDCPWIPLTVPCLLFLPFDCPLLPLTVLFPCTVFSSADP